MKLKIYYLNDEQQRVTVKLMDSSFDPVLCSGERYETLEPAEGREFELDVPEGSILFVKKWSTMVLISFARAASVLLAEELPQAGDV